MLDLRPRKRTSLDTKTGIAPSLGSIKAGFHFGVTGHRYLEKPDLKPGRTSIMIRFRRVFLGVSSANNIKYTMLQRRAL